MNDKTTHVRVSKVLLEDFEKLCSLRGKNRKREQVDLALKYFCDLKLLPDECDSLHKKMEGQTSRYISFFKMAEKNIYKRLDTFLDYGKSGNHAEGLEGISDHFSDIVRLLTSLFESVRLSYFLNLQILSNVADEAYYEKVYEEFSSHLDELKKTLP
jgi:hypothetical protein